MSLSSSNIKGFTTGPGNIMPHRHPRLSAIAFVCTFLQAFEEDEADAEYKEKEALALAMQEAAITDVKSFTQASSRAAVAATAAATAVAVTKACLFLVRHLRTFHRGKFDRSLLSVQLVLRGHCAHACCITCRLGTDCCADNRHCALRTGCSSTSSSKGRKTGACPAQWQLC